MLCQPVLIQISESLSLSRVCWCAHARACGFSRAHSLAPFCSLWLSLPTRLARSPQFLERGTESMDAHNMHKLAHAYSQESIGSDD